MGLRFYRPDMPSAALHPGLLPPARNQPTEIGVEGVYRQVHCMMPRHYSMHCEWLGNDRDSGCSPVIRFVDLGDSPRESPIFKGVSFLTAGHAPLPRSVTIATLIKKPRQKHWGTSARSLLTTQPQRSNAPLTLFQKKT